MTLFISNSCVLNQNFFYIRQFIKMHLKWMWDPTVLGFLFPETAKQI